MITSTLLFLFVSTIASGVSAAHPQDRLLAEDSGMEVARLIQQERHLQGQLSDLPDICSGYELIIDQIPNGRESCDCDGITVHCLFHAICEEGVADPRCADAVMYEVSFLEEELTILSCAALAEGNFLETCAKVSLGPDLLLDQCLLASYGGQDCDCTVCDGRGSLSIDCTMYDERAETDCQSMSLGVVSPMVHGFNHTAPVPEELPTVDDANNTAVSGASSQATITIALSISSILVLFAAVL